LKHRFGVVIDGNQVSKTKPDPEVFLKGSKELGVAPADCLVVEDAPSGVTAAKSAGMKVLGIGSSENLVNADKTVNTLEGISWEDILSI
jgi:beta-phosphoglucomutase